MYIKRSYGHMGNRVSTQIFHTIMIVLNIAAAAVYWFDGDVRRVIYWLAAAVLTASITY